MKRRKRADFLWGSFHKKTPRKLFRGASKKPELNNPSLYKRENIAQTHPTQIRTFARQKRNQLVCALIFSHPDYTVGFGFSPNQPYPGNHYGLPKKTDKGHGLNLSYSKVTPSVWNWRYTPHHAPKILTIILFG